MPLKAFVFRQVKKEEKVSYLTILRTFAVVMWAFVALVIKITERCVLYKIRFFFQQKFMIDVKTNLNLGQWDLKIPSFF